MRAIAILDEREHLPETGPFGFRNTAWDKGFRIEALTLLGEIYTQNNQADKAQSVLELADILCVEKGNTFSVRIRRALGHVERSKGHLASARELFEQCLIEIQSMPDQNNSRSTGRIADLVANQIADLVAELHADIASCDG